MRVSFWAACVLLVIGTVVLLLPDSGDRILSFNEDHGPSWQDFIGITIIVITWAWLLAKSIHRRKLINQSIGKRGIAWAIIGIIIGAIFIAGGLATKFDNALYSGIVISLIGYGVLIVPAFRTPGDVNIPS